MQERRLNYPSPVSLSGYSSPLYAESLGEFGEVRHLSGCEGQVLLRKIQGHSLLDAMGPYPLFCCRHWDKLTGDLDVLADEAVSIVLVLDTFGSFNCDDFKSYFDVFYPYKTHYILEYRENWQLELSKSHRKYAVKSMKCLDVKVIEKPADYLDDWCGLYDKLIQKHSIQGISRFSRNSFLKQLSIPGCILFLVTYNEIVVGGKIYFIHNDCAYDHLSACSEEGYPLRAAYAANWFSLLYLENKVKYIDLGGGSGLQNGEAIGLEQFKKGWSNTTRDAYLAGKILQKENYEFLTKNFVNDHINFFPLYRYNAV